MQLRKILVAVDGSAAADKALEYAIDLAKKYESGLTIMHVMNLPSIPHSIPGDAFNRPIPSTEEIKALLKREGDGVLLKRKEVALGDGVEAETSLVFGDPAEEVLKASEGYDLIVMGRRGQGRLRAMLLGSVSNKVIHYAKRPVLLVNPE
jgi:nucleotide-binding universal stress UspA family protein